MDTILLIALIFCGGVIYGVNALRGGTNTAKITPPPERGNAMPIAPHQTGPFARNINNQLTTNDECIKSQSAVTERTAKKHHTWPEKQQLAQCLGCAALVGDMFKFCPNCGARFMEVTDDKE